MQPSNMSEIEEYVIGVDLSGPANFEDTVLVAFQIMHHHLRLARTIDAASDMDIRRFSRELPASLTVILIVILLNLAASVRPIAGRCAAIPRSKPRLRIRVLSPHLPGREKRRGLTAEL